MEYTTFPNVNSALPPLDTSTNKVNAIQLYGTGSLGGASGLSFAGAGGINGTQGIWLGNKNFASAPFSVDLQGNVKASTLKVAGAILIGGAAADINSHSTTVSGNKITGASITSSQIANSTITGSNISGSTITGSNIAASTITAGLINVSTLSAISANIGTVTAGAINGLTVTGGTVQTASSGQRVVLSGSSNDLEFFNSAGTQIGSVSSHTVSTLVFMDIINPATNGIVNIQASGSNGAMTFLVNGGNGISVSSTNVGITGNTAITGNLSVTGTKPFDIFHPTRKGYRLRYVAIESPEVLVMCRGRGKVVYPQHFIDISEPGTFQVVKSGTFWNRTWVATAIRKGYKDHVTEYEGESAADHPEQFAQL